MNRKSTLFIGTLALTVLGFFANQMPTMAAVSLGGGKRVATPAPTPVDFCKGSNGVIDFNIVDLGSPNPNPSGWQYANPSSLNNNGIVVGGLYGSTTMMSSGMFRYTNSGMVDLNFPDLTVYDSYGLPVINDSGEMIYSRSNGESFRSDNSGGYIQLNGLNPADIVNISDVNNGGVVIGRNLDANTSESRTVYWTASTPLDLGIPDSEGLGINDSNKIIGSAHFLNSYNQYAQKGFVSDTSGNAVYLPSIQPAILEKSEAYDINNINVVVGKANKLGVYRPTVWFPPYTQAIELNTFPYNSLSGVAIAINDQNYIIGSVGNSKFLYGLGVGGTGGLGFLDFSAFVPTSTGWSNLNPIKINNNCEIVGQGTFNGHQTSFKMTPI